MEKKKILIVEDELVIALDIKFSLENYGYEVTDVVATGDEALDSIEEVKPELVVIDIILDDSQSGIELARKIKMKYDIQVLYITALIDNETYENAKKTNPVCYLVKPYRENELVQWIEKALS